MGTGQDRKLRWHAPAQEGCVPTPRPHQSPLEIHQMPLLLPSGKQSTFLVSQHTAFQY